MQRIFPLLSVAFQAARGAVLGSSWGLGALGSCCRSGVRMAEIDLLTWLQMQLPLGRHSVLLSRPGK